MVASVTRKAEIRDTALDLFTRYGYEAATMGDIAGVMGIRGPSLYKHVSSKQVLLAEIMTATMDALWAAHTSAVSSTGDSVEQLRRAVEAHVRFHARHRQEAFVGNREIRSLAEPARASVLASRSEYERSFRTVIENGLRAGVFSVASPRLASYAILDLGMGVAAWFRDDIFDENEVAWQQVEFALRIVGAT